MMLRIASLLSLLLLAAPAQALKLSVWDRELQTKLGDGESSGGRFNVRLVEDYDGPVIVLFAQTDDEKAKNTFPNLRSRYNGTLSKGQLSLQPAAIAAQSLDTTTRVASATAAPANTGVTLAKFLQMFKLQLSAQPSGLSFSLPGLKMPDAAVK